MSFNKEPEPRALTFSLLETAESARLLTVLTSLKTTEEEVDRQCAQSRLSFLHPKVLYYSWKIERLKYQGRSQVRRLKKKYRCTEIDWREMPFHGSEFL